MSVSLDQDNNTVNNFRSMLSNNNRPSFIVVTCLICDSSVGISNEFNAGKGKISLYGCDVKIGVTVCHGCGVRTKFGRVYSMVDINRLTGKTIVKRLHEEAVRHNCSVDYIPNMVYLKSVVQQLSFRIFSVCPGPNMGMGLRSDGSVYTDLIRS